MHGQQDIVSIVAQGSVNTVFTSVRYGATVVGLGETGPKAKEAARAATDAIKRVIAKNKDKAKIGTRSLKTTQSVDEVSRYDRDTNEQVPSGYKATFTISFIGTEVSEASALHDELTSIPNVRAPSPQFLVDSDDDLEDEAFKNGVEKAKGRFARQCKTLGLDPTKYEVLNWTSAERSNREHVGKTMASAALESVDSPVKLEPGKAEYVVQVTVNFAPKDANARTKGQKKRSNGRETLTA